MKRLLIVGSEGFTGRHFCRYLANAPHDFLVARADIVSTDGVAGKSKGYTRIDSPETLGRIIGEFRPHYIANFAGLFGNADFPRLLEANVLTTERILNAASAPEQEVEKILLVGSAAEYGTVVRNPVSEKATLQPINEYGLSKAMQSQLAEYYSMKLPIVLARTFNIYGTGMSKELAIGAFEQQIAAAQTNDVIRVGNLSSQRDYLSIEDVVQRYMILLNHGASGEVYNVCSGEPRAMSEILSDMIRASGKTLKIEVDPNRYKGEEVSVIYGDATKYNDLVRQCG